MLLILIGIFTLCLIAIIIYGSFRQKNNKSYYDTDGGAGNVALGITDAIIILSLIIGGFIGLSSNFIDCRAAENQIIIVEESNAELEEEVGESVRQFMKYEGEELKALKPDTNNTELIAFAESYPNLQSSKLIQEQINTYKENKKKIVKLKQSQEQNKQTIRYWTFINLK